ncbi:hypothetical protein PtA15_10A396 [Puccinia triticina]|uniref:Uncharacterized protein n=1 Tax=Puccinia triticina TaxID=208348 RepID=A0ABY7CUK2_9BASI|nr:uncharacterized protein PtA15_10A396 [Puccinia triticina]WAQ88973.1 hypothetical protein PtA15_10A396 [Puccinia triticina]WAR59029.1 hypothetical protein PtB15_10B371 [Puccinia triticina]
MPDTDARSLSHTVFHSHPSIPAWLQEPVGNICLLIRVGAKRVPPTLLLALAKGTTEEILMGRVDSGGGPQALRSSRRHGTEYEFILKPGLPEIIFSGPDIFTGQVM